MDTSIIVIALLILSILLGVVLILFAYWKKKRIEPVETDYRMFYIVGVIFVPTGIFFSILMLFLGIPFVVGIPLLALGAIYIAIGLENRDKWKTE